MRYEITNRATNETFEFTLVGEDIYYDTTGERPGMLGFQAVDAGGACMYCDTGSYADFVRKCKRFYKSVTL